MKHVKKKLKNEWKKGRILEKERKRTRKAKIEMGLKQWATWK